MMHKTKRMNAEHGFTLIELLVVVSIIIILAAIAVPSYFSYLDKARITVSLSLLSSLERDMEAYKNENQQYPASINFTNFTDQNGGSVLLALKPSDMQAKMYSWETYTTSASSGTFTLTARAIDTKHTTLTLTPQGAFK